MRTEELTTTGLRVPRGKFIGDMISGLIMAIVTIPGAIANGVLAGINERVMEQLEKTELMDLLGEEDLFPVEPRFGAALEKALAAGQAWIDAAPPEDAAARSGDDSVSE
ncbi:MAG: hypothetical protein JSW55_05780 [Chloroflexota bacterium]|nr:MAG: hypothetical protein JSW55_05780 [Chloroflexota bacterium]